jgi:hypothetical protein
MVIIKKEQREYYLILIILCFVKVLLDLVHTFGRKIMLKLFKIYDVVCCKNPLTRTRVKVYKVDRTDDKNRL